jgi:hypothetical protein
VAKSKRTGAKRRALDRAIKRGDLFGQLVSRLALPRRFDKAGRPEGTRPTERRKKDLRALLVCLGRPDLSDEKIIPLLHEPVADLDVEISATVANAASSASVAGSLPRTRERTNLCCATSLPLGGKYGAT